MDDLTLNKRKEKKGVMLSLSLKKALTNEWMLSE
jgi:hypothetical protein